MEQVKTKNKTFILLPRISLLLWQILIPILLQAKEVSEHEVRAAVETWVRYITADARPDAVIEKMEAYQSEGETVAYIAHLLGGGFCLCGADDLVLPVYLYCPTGSYRADDPNYQYVLWEIKTRLTNLQKGLSEGDPKIQVYQNALYERSNYWREIIAGKVPDRKIQPEIAISAPVEMILPLTSKWHQDWPYNNECPVLTPPDEHTVVGCVATAMSQIMYYWKWPNSGVGDANVTYEYRFRTNWDEEPLVKDPEIPLDWSTRLQWTSADGGKLRMNGYWDESLYESAQKINPDSDYLDALETLWDRLTESSTNHYANFGATIYNWSTMHDMHPASSGDYEVAKLCRDVGIALNMNYGIHGSGAHSEDIDDTLEDHFHYDSDAYDSGSNIWKIIEEIQWLRPVAFGGRRNITSKLSILGSVGHEWVVLGYKLMTMQFLMNMGKGESAGWYTFDQVYPIDQSQVIEIAPQNIVKFVGAADEGDGSPDDPHKNIEEALVKAPNGATLIFKAGSDNTFYASSLVINRPFVLRGYNVTIRKQ